MPGERFSVLYLQSGNPVPDSTRARYRVGSLFREPVFQGHTEQLAAQLGRTLGTPMPGNGKNPSHWHQFMRECSAAHFLDTVTVVYRYLFWHLCEGAANWWRDVVRQIFTEERLAYEIDDVGGVHPRVDREFQRNLVSAVVVFQSERYQQISELIESCSNNLVADPPNYRQALRAIFSATDVLFGLTFPYARLSTEEIERRLRPHVERAYEGDPTAQRAAQEMVAGFGRWVAASQIYQHRPGAAEPAQPPADIAILSISCGISLMRWLAGLDEVH